MNDLNMNIATVAPNDITVIIVNWNSGITLQQCLNALANQSYQNFNIVVIDNSSEDASEECCLDYANVILHRATKNLGFAAANNMAIKECQSKYIVLLNPDAFPEPTWLEELLIAATRYSSHASFGSRQLSNHDRSVLDGVGDAYHISGLAWRKRHGKKQSIMDLLPQEIFSPCAAAALYKREVLLDIGGFDEEFFCYFEDVDLGFRLQLAGYRCRYVPSAVVHHIGSGSTGGGQSDFSIYHGHRNLVWAYVKNMPSILFWIFLPLHIMLNLISITWFGLHGKGAIILKAKKDAILGLPIMWEKRKNIQSKRIASISAIWKQLHKVSKN